MKTFFNFLMISIILLFINCGLHLNYARINSNYNLDLANKKVSIININIPILYLENNNNNLKLIMLNDIINTLNKKHAIYFNLKIPKKIITDNKIYKKDKFNWFFKSDSFYQVKTIVSNNNLTNMDYLMQIDVLKFEKGISLNDSWIKFIVYYFSAKDNELLMKTTCEGFYKNIMEKL